MVDNFFDDSFSQKSGTTAKSKNKELRAKEEAASDKKKLKIIKEALKEERRLREEATEQLEALKSRSRELEKECNETSNKYLKLYDENDKLQEYIQSLQYQVSSGGSAKEAPLVDLSFLKDGEQKSREVMSREMQLQHESELNAMGQASKKAEKEANQNEMEMIHYKQMATELAE